MSRTSSPAPPDEKEPRRRRRVVAAGRAGTSLFQRRRTPPGAAPGTMIADDQAVPPKIHVIAYGTEGLEEQDLGDLDELPDLLKRHGVTWVDVQGLSDIDTIRRLGDIFGLHALALEDVINVHQRPKVDDYGDHLFIVTRMPATGSGPHDTEQLALFLGERYVLTFQEHYGDCFDPIRHRLRAAPGSRIRTLGGDYLAYALIDAAVDSFFPVLEHYGETVEHLESEVVERPEDSVVARIHTVKRELLGLRRAVWPQREMVSALIRDDTPLLSETTKLYLRDCYDHAVQILDILETYREISSGLVDVYLSSMSTKLNEVMKVLTVIATIFMPLGFIASLYGMNFDRSASPWNMPELGWPFGYPLVLGLMLAIAVAMLMYFRAKGWVGRRPDRRIKPD